MGCGWTQAGGAVLWVLLLGTVQGCSRGDDEGVAERVAGIVLEGFLEGLGQVRGPLWLPWLCLKFFLFD